MNLSQALRLEATPSPHVIALTGGGGKTSTLYRLAAELTAQDRRVVCTATTRLAAYEVESAPGMVEVMHPALPDDAIRQALDAHKLCLLVTPEIVDAGMKKYPGVSMEVVDVLAARAEEFCIDTIIVEADGAKMLPLKAPALHEPLIPSSTTTLLSFVGMDALGRPIADGSVHRPELVRKLLGLGAEEEQLINPFHMAKLLSSSQGGRKHHPAGARCLAVLNKADTSIQRACARISARLLCEKRMSSLISSTGNQEFEAVHERWAPTSVIVLAGGNASRFGEPKQVAEVDGESLITSAVNTARQSGANEVIVVTGAHAVQTEKCLMQRFGHDHEWLRIVHNMDWEQGQSTSMRAGLDALSMHAQSAIFMPVDQPYLSVSLLRNLIRAWRMGADIVAPNVDGQQRGSPALFDWRFWDELRAVRGDIGGREVLNKHIGDVVSVNATAAELLDIDTPSDRV